MKDNKHFNHLMATLVLFLMVSVAFVFFSTIKVVRESNNIKSQDYVSITGEGEVFAKPDLAIVSFSVKNETKEASTALSENTEKTNAVIDFLKKQGVEEKDIKTTAFSIYPRYEYRSNKELYYYEGERILVGYEVQQTVEVKLRDMEKIGEIVNGGVKAGANQVQNLSFVVEKEEDFKKEARKMAIDSAKEEAKLIEKQLGVKLGKLVGFSESSSYDGVYSRTLGMGEMKESADYAVPEIATGENKITAKIVLTYEIR